MGLLLLGLQHGIGSQWIGGGGGDDHDGLNALLVTGWLAGWMVLLVGWHPSGSSSVCVAGYILWIYEFSVLFSVFRVFLLILNFRFPRPSVR